jgi:protein-disulfide isomerase
MKYVLFAVSCLVLIAGFFLASSLYKADQAEKLGSIARDNYSVFVREHSRTLGSEDAKVELVEFMDPACETCAAFSPLVKKIMAAYPGKIRLVLRYAPFHDGADYFVKILEAAGKQDKYWEVLDTLYKSQPYWASHHNPRPQAAWQFLAQTGIDLARIRRDMEDPSLQRLIEQDLADARALNVNKTPGFFVNGKPLKTFGARQLQGLILSEVKANYPGE